MGRVWTAEELTAFAGIAQRHGLIVVSDEIHGDLMLHGRSFTPWLSLPASEGVRSIVCSAPSKTFNLAGLKSSCLVIPDAAMRAAFRRARDRTGVYGVNPLSAAAAEAAWRGGAAWLDRVLGYLSANARALDIFFRERSELGIRVTPLEGAYLAWLDFRETRIAAPDLEAFLLEKARLRLEDGGIFGPEGKGFARMNLACPRPLLDEALARLAEAMTP